MGRDSSRASAPLPSSSRPCVVLLPLGALESVRALVAEELAHLGAKSFHAGVDRRRLLDLIGRENAAHIEGGGKPLAHSAVRACDSCCTSVSRSCGVTVPVPCSWSAIACLAALSFATSGARVAWCAVRMSRTFCFWSVLKSSA